MKHAVALLGATAVLAAVLVGPASAPASAVALNLGGLDVTPAASNVGTDVTVTPLAPCPAGSTQAFITYSNPDGTVVDSVSVALDEELGWIDTIRPDAGQYAVSVICQGPNNQVNAGHLAASGVQLITTGTYNDESFQVNGIVTGTPDPAISGGNITLSVAAASACQPAGGFPVGIVRVGVRGPNGEDLLALPLATVDNGFLAADGTFSVGVPIVEFAITGPALGITVVPTPPGTYSISGSCQRSVASGAGHRAAAQAQPLNDNFTYTGSFEVVANPTVETTTTTTVPPTDVAADAVTANPTFTG